VRILVTGRDGQVARSLAEVASGHDDLEIVFAARPQLDLAKPETIAAALDRAKPDIVVSAAAYTAVDQAEDDVELAYTINMQGSGEVARSAAALSIPVIHISTDYVFDGLTLRPYREDDTPGPLNVYGASKLGGEQMVRVMNPRHVILRTAWVYSSFGRNFVKTMLRLAGERQELGVVDDQHGNPTSASDIAQAIIHIARRLSADGKDCPWGIFHLAGTGDASWSELADFVLKESAARGGPSMTIRPIMTADYPTRAKRPPDTRLSIEILDATSGCHAPPRCNPCRRLVARLIEGQCCQRKA
jgi:dTDP-4-dehydrorhamnose reductase